MRKAQVTGLTANSFQLFIYTFGIDWETTFSSNSGTGIVNLLILLPGVLLAFGALTSYRNGFPWLKVAALVGQTVILLWESWLFVRLYSDPSSGENLMSHAPALVIILPLTTLAAIVRISRKPL